MNILFKKPKRIQREQYELDFHENSSFIATFEDGEQFHEKDTSWNDMSSKQKVKYSNGFKTVRLNSDIKHLHIQHGDQSISLEVPEGHQVYQAIRAETVFTRIGKKDRITGRVIGLVKDGEVVQEQVINSLEHQVLGFRK